MMDMGALIMIASLKQKKIINKIIVEQGYSFELAHLKILMAAVHYPGKLYAKDLVAIEGKSKSTINALLVKLESENLVSLEVDELDKRAKIIKATKKGILVDKELSIKVQEIVSSKFMKDMSPNEIESFIKTIKKLIKNIDEVIGEDALPYADLVHEVNNQ